MPREDAPRAFEPLTMGKSHNREGSRHELVSTTPEYLSVPCTVSPVQCSAEEVALWPKPEYGEIGVQGRGVLREAVRS